MQQAFSQIGSLSYTGTFVGLAVSSSPAVNPSGCVQDEEHVLLDCPSADLANLWIKHHLNLTTSNSFWSNTRSHWLYRRKGMSWNL